MKRRFLSLALAGTLMMQTLGGASAAAAETEPTISVGKTVAVDAGSVVEVPLTLAGNPGILGMQLSVNYPEGFTLEKTAKGDALKELTYTPPGEIPINPVTLLWDGQDQADTSNGTIVTLSLLVPEEAESGKYPIRLNVNEMIDKDLKELHAACVNGTIAVTLGSADVMVAVPAQGVDLAQTVTCGSENYTGVVEWYEGTEGKGTLVTGAAKADTIYTAKITLSPAEDQQFSKKTAVTVNGGEAETVTPDDKTGKLVIQHTFSNTKPAPKCDVPQGVTAVYGQTLAEIELKNPEGNTPGTWTWNNPSERVGNAGKEPHTFQATFTPEEKNLSVMTDKSISVTVSPKEIKPTVEGVTAKDYTGTQIVQDAVTVKDGSDTLAETEYEIVYGENVNAGTDAGSLTIKAKDGGNYKFADQTVKFTIHKVAYTGPVEAMGAAKFGTSGTVDLSGLLQADCKLSGTVKVMLDENKVLKEDPTLSGTTLTFQFVEEKEQTGNYAMIVVPVTESTNYKPYSIVVTVTVLDKLPQEKFKFAKAEQVLTYGQSETYQPTGAVDGSTVTYQSDNADVAEVDAAGKVTTKKVGTAVITATASAVGEYAEGKASYKLRVEPATVTVMAKDRTIKVNNTVPDLTSPKENTDYIVTGLVGEDKLTGTVTMKYQKDGKDTEPDNTKTGTYDIVISGVSVPNENYKLELKNGKLTVEKKSDSGSSDDGNSGSSGGSSSGGNTGNKTQKNEDGSVTTTKTDKKTGTVTATTKYPNGTVSTVTTEKDGTQKISATLPEKVMQAAQESGKAVELPIPPVAPVKDTAKAVPVTVSLANDERTKVELPVENVTPGTVAVIVKADGTEEVVKTTIPTEDGIVLTLEKSETLKIVDNSRTFTDVSNSAWYADQVRFVSSRELFQGTSSTEFSPAVVMNRGMLVTVLYRLENEPDTANSLFADVRSDQYYAKAVAWASAKNIVNGYGNGQFGPDDSITREQLAVMLWRYAGSPSGTGSFSGFTDSSNVSTWASDALRWAIGAGIISGKGNGILDPTGQATRAEVAAMLMRYMVNGK